MDIPTAITSERTSCSNGGTTQAREVVAIGMGDLLDQTECAQSRDLSRQRRDAHVHMLGEIGTAQAMHVVLAALQGSQQCLLAAVEEVQSFDLSLIAAYARLAQTLKVALTRAWVIQTGQKRQVALVAAQHDLAQVDQAIDGFLQRCQLVGALPILVFHPATRAERAVQLVGDQFARRSLKTAAVFASAAFFNARRLSSSVRPRIR
jgi:hypothetical protein